MWYKNVGTTFFRFVMNHAFDWRTDSYIVAIPRCMQCMQRCMQRGKNLINLLASWHTDQLMNVKWNQWLLLASRHFGSKTFRQQDTSAAEKYYRSVWTLRQHCRCVLRTLWQCSRSVSWCRPYVYSPSFGIGGFRWFNFKSILCFPIVFILFPGVNICSCLS